MSKHIQKSALKSLVNPIYLDDGNKKKKKEKEKKKRVIEEYDDVEIPTEILNFDNVEPMGSRMNDGSQGLSNDAASDGFDNSEFFAENAEGDQKMANDIEKLDLLAKIEKYSRQGGFVTRKYTNKNSDLHELRLEWGRILHQRQTESIKETAMITLSGGVGALESLQQQSSCPKIIRGKLNGFSKHMESRLYEYDDAFEALGDRYGGLAFGKSSNPIIQILLIFISQLARFFLESWSKGGEYATMALTSAQQQENIRQAVEMASRDFETRLNRERESYTRTLSSLQAEVSSLRRASAPANSNQFWNALAQQSKPAIGVSPVINLSDIVEKPAYTISPNEMTVVNPPSIPENREIVVMDA